MYSSPSSKQLLILDLDETLIYSTAKKLKHKEAFLCGKYFVYTRPHLNWFLTEIAHHFRLGIWSAADETYVSEIVRQILPQGIQLEILWGQSWCTCKPSLENKSSIYEKDISKLTELNFKREDIILVDDSLWNTKLNKENSILIKPFTGDQNDNELKTLFADLVALQKK
jgi:carboxy-terminal domain RNA polymerase II polypeptide A small phosphatase